MLAYKFRLYPNKEEERKREGTVGTTGTHACGQPTSTAAIERSASRLVESRTPARNGGVVRTLPTGHKKGTSWTDCNDSFVEIDYERVKLVTFF